MEIRSGLDYEVYLRYYRQDGSEQVCHAEGGYFGNVSSGEHPYTQTHVPRGEVGTGGRAALVVGCQVHEQGIIGGEHGSEADAQQQGDGEEQHRREPVVPGDGPSACRNQEIADAHHVGSGYDDLGDLPFVDQLSAEQAADGHPDSHQGEEESHFGLDAYLEGIHGHVVRCHAVGDGKQEQAEARGKSLEQDETVERYRLSLYRRLVGGLYGACRKEAHGAGSYRGDEDGVVRHAVAMQEESDHRSYRHGQVVGQTVVAQSFAPAGRGHDVYHDGVASHGHHPERYAVYDAEHDEQGKEARHHVAGEDGDEDEVGEQVKRFPGERVEQVARERTDAERRDGIARQYETDHGVRGVEVLGQVEGQDGGEQPEPEV